MARITVEDLEIDPLKGSDLHFTIISDGERQSYSMSRALARKVSHKTSRMLDDAAIEQAAIIPIWCERLEHTA